jgi:hypothetical protein
MSQPPDAGNEDVTKARILGVDRSPTPGKEGPSDRRDGMFLKRRLSALAHGMWNAWAYPTTARQARLAPAAAGQRPGAKGLEMAQRALYIASRGLEGF